MASPYPVSLSLHSPRMLPGPFHGISFTSLQVEIKILHLILEMWHQIKIKSK
jgi:hypothetical protein